MNCFFFVFFFFAKLIWHEVWPFFFGFWMVHLREDCYFSLCFDLFDQMCFFFVLFAKFHRFGSSCKRG
jgi:hypothetical protein